MWITWQTTRASDTRFLIVIAAAIAIVTKAATVVETVAKATLCSCGVLRASCDSSASCLVGRQDCEEAVARRADGDTGKEFGFFAGHLRLSEVYRRGDRASLDHRGL